MPPAMITPPPDRITGNLALASMRAAANQPVGLTAEPLHSYFALIGWAPVQDLLADETDLAAQRAQLGHSGRAAVLLALRSAFADKPMAVAGRCAHHHSVIC